MSTVTIQFGSVNPTELRAILVAHKNEFEVGEQPAHIATSYIQEHDRVVGCFVRLAGPGPDGDGAFTVTTLPLSPASAALVAQAVAQ